MIPSTSTLQALIDIADCILLGGRMAFTFLAAEGIHVGQVGLADTRA